VSGGGAAAKWRTAARNPQSAPSRPLLKWAGGKRQLLPRLRGFYPADFNRYIEPFFGSGAVFFDLHGAGRLAGRGAILIDSNADLIGCYRTVRDAPEAVAQSLERLAASRARDARKHYFTVRDELFNPERARRRQADGDIAYTPELAAMFLYLNRTGFNGLFRVNASGAFNVPPGRYERPRLVDRDRLTEVATALSAPGVELRRGSFEITRDIACAGDFLYFDPPYAPLTATANFTAYTAGKFDADDQVRLQQIVIELARRGCHIIVSNSTAKEIARLYDGNADARRAGFRAHRVAARRAINRDAARRGPVDEYVITNQIVAG
jgi:DNA adenine methylase